MAKEMGREVSGEGRAAREERVFLSAEWRDLVMVNYAVDPRLLRDYVPRGTELDSFGGHTYISLVGFRFLRTKLFGVLPVPFHTNFDEINLRFYVRRREGGEDRRGVVFIREIVPKRAVAMVARLAYGENYSRYPTRHLLSVNGARKVAQYEWRLRSGQWARIHAESGDDPELVPIEVRSTMRRPPQDPVFPAEGSLEQFITEHFWGYARQRDGGTVEYHVTHPPWRVWQETWGVCERDTSEVYGREFGPILQGPPPSGFIAEGSPVVVYRGRRIA